MNLDRNGKLFIARREGIALGAYPDGALMSIGMGDQDRDLKPGDSITIAQAFERLDKATVSREKWLSTKLAHATQEQFNALFSAYYQAGNRVAPWLVKLHNSGVSLENMRTAFSISTNCTDAQGKFRPGIRIRREAEGALYATGQYEKDLDIMTVYDGNPRDHHTKAGLYKVSEKDLPL